MNFLDYITIILFSAGIILIGLTFAKRSKKNMRSFFAAGGAVPWQMSGLSLFMGFFSAGTFVVWGSIAYSLGWVSITIQWTMAIAGFIVGLLIAPRWHETGVLTAAEYITKRFDIETQKVYTYLFLFISLFTTGSFLYPVAKIIEVSTGLPLNASILLIGGFCILYVSVGGLWAVMSTDVLQFVILTAVVIIVVPLAINHVGGVEAFVDRAPDNFFDLANSDYTVGFIIAFGFYNAIFLGGNWAYVQRYTCVKNKKNSRKVGWLFGLLYIISPLLWMLPPMLYRVVNTSLGGLDNEGAYLLMCKEVLPTGILGLMLGGMIFATASSLNATLNISSGVITNDIFKRLRPHSTSTMLMKVARISTIGIGILTVIIALLIPLMGGIVNVVISVAALTGVPLYLPIIWSLFSKRQDKTSVLTTTIFSLAVNVFFKFVAPVLFHLSLSRTEEMILGVLFPIICLALFEYYYDLVHKKSVQYERYIAMQQIAQGMTLEKDSLEVSDNNAYSLRIIGCGVGFIGLDIILLGTFSQIGKILIICIGIFLLLLGSYMIKKSIIKLYKSND